MYSNGGGLTQTGVAVGIVGAAGTMVGKTAATFGFPKAGRTIGLASLVVGTVGAVTAAAGVVLGD